MALDKLVDSSQLNACCTAEANAIRAKTGSAASIAFDWANSKGFADAIAAISGGGSGYDFSWPTYVTEVTIGANSVANTQQASDYFTSSGTRVLAIMEDAATITNQVVAIMFGPNRCVRKTSSGYGTSVNVASNYTGYLVEGTKYVLLAV